MPLLAPAATTRCCAHRSPSRLCGSRTSRSVDDPNGRLGAGSPVDPTLFAVSARAPLPNRAVSRGARPRPAVLRADGRDVAVLQAGTSGLARRPAADTAARPRSAGLLGVGRGPRASAVVVRRRRRSDPRVGSLVGVASSPAFSASRSTSLPSASTTLAFSSDRRERLAAGDLGDHRRASGRPRRPPWRSRSGSMPYCAARHDEVLDQLVLADADLLLLGDRVEQELGAAAPCGCSRRPRRGARRPRGGPRSRGGGAPRPRRARRAPGSRSVSSSCSSTLSRAWTPCSKRLACSAWACAGRRCSSSRVSNSLASWAKSSSSSGSSRSLTDCTVTVTSASWPSRSPPASGAVKVLVSPAVMPTSASSRPSIMLPVPIS